MADIIRKRLATGREEGFTLIELLVVIVILGILLAIAVPSYMNLQTRANRAAARSNIRAALPDVQVYYQDNNQSYVGMSLASLQAIDSAIKLDALVAAQQTATGYCIAATVGGLTYKKNATDPEPVVGTC